MADLLYPKNMLLSIPKCWEGLLNWHCIKMKNDQKYKEKIVRNGRKVNKSTNFFLFSSI